MEQVARFFGALLVAAYSGVYLLGALFVSMFSTFDEGEAYMYGWLIVTIPLVAGLVGLWITDSVVFAWFGAVVAASLFVFVVMAGTVVLGIGGQEVTFTPRNSPDKELVLGWLAPLLLLLVPRPAGSRWCDLWWKT